MEVCRSHLAAVLVGSSGSSGVEVVLVGSHRSEVHNYTVAAEVASAGSRSHIEVGEEHRIRYMEVVATVLSMD